MGLSFKTLFWTGAILLFVYCEFVAYWILPLKWTEQPNCSPPYCKKLLLVADPQIVGPEWSNFPLMDWIAIFDSDRYIKRTFAETLNYVQPDIVVFLGDLTDQGWMASQSEYDVYLSRLKNIFDMAGSLGSMKVIFSPGDNDIGGIEEILNPLSVQKFEKALNQTEESTLTEFIEFCNANLMTYKLQQSKFIDQSIIRIALSHVPLVPKRSYFLNEVVKKIRPHIILSGHLHKAYHYITHENDLWQSKRDIIIPHKSFTNTYHFEEGLIHEIVVPTCSYRMGVKNMGYGVAYVDIKEMNMQFTVLWLPHRFLQLFVYLFILSQIIILEIVKICRRIRRHNQQKNMNNKLYVSLI